MAKPAKSGLGKGLSALLGDKPKGDDPADAPPPEKAAAPQPILPDGEVNSVQRVDINPKTRPSQPRKSFDRDAESLAALSRQWHYPADGGARKERRATGTITANAAGGPRRLPSWSTPVVREADAVLEMALVENLQRRSQPN